jgi:hypothetical protein
MGIFWCIKLCNNFPDDGEKDFVWTETLPMAGRRILFGRKPCRWRGERFCLDGNFADDGEKDFVWTETLPMEGRKIPHLVMTPI